MATINRITKDKGEFYVIWLSTGATLRVSEDILVRYRLLKGQELTSEELTALKKASSYDVGLQMAMNYLSYQLRSKKEIDHYLKDKEIALADRQKIVQRLTEIKLLDDAVFSESYVRTMMRTSDKGPRTIAQQLKQKGISELDIQHGLSFYTMEEQLQVAIKTAQKAMKRYRSKSFKDALQKVRLHLTQKGFNGEIIDLALEELNFEKDEEQEQAALQKEGDRLWRANHRLEPAKRYNKVKQSLFQKGFDYDLIQQYMEEKEQENEE
ncbi:recombination regulator RecX [Enterococcus faecalis]